MSGLDKMRMRTQYYGGDPDSRLVKDKLRSLRSALYSYQGQTAILEDGRKFKCLINKNKETGDYDYKIISIPYKDICLNPKEKIRQKTSEGLEEIGLKCGDTFEWEETGTHWLVFLQYLEEEAYFRSQIVKCEQQTKVGDKNYWTYIRGPVETSIPWNQKAGIEWNDMNYSLVMFIKLDENTIDNLHRFSKLKIMEPQTKKLKTWQVVGVNPYYADGIIQVFLDEYFENSIQDAVDKMNKKDDDLDYYKPLPRISGPDTVSYYDTVKYKIEGLYEGKWYCYTNEEKIFVGEGRVVSLDIYMKKGSFDLVFEQNDEEKARKTISIEAF